jgi:hypothetical protein
VAKVNFFANASAAPFPLSNNPPLDVGATSPGVMGAASRDDHVHAHGNQLGGPLHALVTTLVDGFMSFADKVKLNGIAAGAQVNTVTSVFGRLGAVVAVAGDYAFNQLSGTPTTLAGYGITDAVPTSEKGAALGVATLDAGSKIPAAQIPQIAISETFIVGSQAAMLALVAEQGDVAVRTDLNKSFILAADPATILANWVELLTPTDAVLSVFGRVGAVVSAIGDYAFAQISGTITDAQHAARGGDTLHAVATALLAGFMSAADKTKLDGLPASASDRAMIFFGGASMGGGDTGKHFGAQEGSNGGKVAALSSDNQMSCGIAGTVSLLTWNSVTADGTTVFKINKNGLVVATLTLTGVSGSIAVAGVTSVLGDLFAVEYDAGTSPGRTTVQVWAYA